MTREEELDWLCRLRSEIYVYMPKEWLIPMNNALDMAISALSEELSEDGTLTVHVKDGSKVKRVLVMGDNIFGGLYYPDSAENKGDTVSRVAYEQIMWERDTAIQQLKDLGYGLGEKPKENKGEWIPIESEEKPEDYDRVLITVNGCRGLIVREAQYRKARNEFEVLHNHERWEVGEKGLLAWQPMPESYKAERGK